MANPSYICLSSLFFFSSCGLNTAAQSKDVDAFWSLLGGKPAVLSKVAPEPFIPAIWRYAPPMNTHTNKQTIQLHIHLNQQYLFSFPFFLFLFSLSNAAGKTEFTEVSKGYTLNKSVLNTNDVFICDLGFHIYIWIGKKASREERDKAVAYGLVCSC